MPDLVIGLIDGPVSMDHPDLATENVATSRENRTRLAAVPIVEPVCMALLSLEFSPQNGSQPLPRFVLIVTL